MSLRERILLVLIFILCCYTAFEYSAFKFVIAPEMEKQEQEQARQTLQRCTDAFRSQLSELQNRTRSLGLSGLLADCASGSPLSSVEIPQDFSSIDFLIIYDHQWTRQTSEGIAPDLLDPLEQRFFEPKTGFIKKKIPGYSGKALIFHDGRPVFACSAPITQAATPTRLEGMVIAGQFVTAQRLDILTDQLRLKLNWEVIDPARPMGSARPLLQNADSVQPFYFEPLGDDYLQASTLVYDDMTKQPALVVKLNQDRSIARQGLRSISTIICFKIVVGVSAIILLTLLLQRVIINPITKFIKHVVSVGHTSVSEQTLSLARKDEIGVLANEFNQMCQRLQDAQIKLMEKSYLSGVAEMSSGILHNVRNAISPITTRIERLKGQFEEIPLDHLRKARTELRADDTAPERQKDLLRFVDLTFETVIGNLKEVVEGLDDLAEQVLQIEDMLNIQRTFGRADKPVQFIRPAELIKKALDMIPEDQPQKNRVTVDSTINKLSAIPVEPSTFTQVLQNLLVNASESLDREKPLVRKIRVSAQLELHDEREMIHWRIQDNGAGIPPEKIQHIFERGASSKRKGLTGIGLHWCANTVTAMKGRIWAESSGDHSGAVFHILIPINAEQEAMILSAKEDSHER